MSQEYQEMESSLKAKLLENQRLATQQHEKMKKDFNKQKGDIELVMELNSTLKIKIAKMEEKK